jgi:hypothetical protein
MASPDAYTQPVTQPRRCGCLVFYGAPVREPAALDHLAPTPHRARNRIAAGMKEIEQR